MAPGPAYSLDIMTLETVFAAVHSLEEVTLSSLCDLVARPSVAGATEELAATAALVAEMAGASGFKTEIWDTPGQPVVFADLPGPPGSPTLLFYGHYDVQPADPISEWDTPPFVPTVRQGALFGRGAGDNKGQFLAHIMAIRALLSSGGCPVGVKLLIEGEEEVGSPNLDTTVRSHAEQLTCDLALTADGPLHDDGRPLVIFGVRGLLMLEIRATGASHDVHSGNRGGWAPMPAWNLVAALSTLRDADGRIAIPDFYRDVLPPTEQERQLMDLLPVDPQSIRTELGVDRLPGAGERSPWEALMFEPTLNLPGLVSGYTGPGMKTIVPREAIARVEMRLVPNQDPDAVEESVRHHLRGFDLEIHRLAAVPPSRTAADCPYVEGIVAALQATSGQPPLLRPRLGGTTPDHVFTQILDVPSLLIPYGSPQMFHHAPNERIRLADLYRGTRSTAAICVVLGKASAAAAE